MNYRKMKILKSKSLYCFASFNTFTNCLIMFVKVGETGSVVSFDISAEQSDIALRHFATWCESYRIPDTERSWPDNVEFRTGDLSDYKSQPDQYDLVTTCFAVFIRLSRMNYHLIICSL